MDKRFDPALFDLIPHRPPMLLINKVLELSDKSSAALVTIDKQASFYEPNKGVPTWIGLEYMGQTAALIAGYQRQKGMIGPHMGFLLGTRAYKAQSDYFDDGITLRVSCAEKILVGDDLVTFDCQIQQYDPESSQHIPLATASLSVMRRPIKEKE